VVAVEADLLVVGSSRRGLLGRVLIGDDTRAALNGAPCAIAIAPAGYSREPTPMSEIGVGYNGSPESEHALELARLLAADIGAKLSASRRSCFRLASSTPVGSC
jgi:nucleotide-binding universal stress UspA family protein